MSRVRRRQDLKFLILDDPNQMQGYERRLKLWFTRNKVIRQLWDTSMAAKPPIPLADRAPPPQAHLEASVRSLSL